MNLLIAFVIQYSVLVNGTWVPQQQEGVIAQAVTTCHSGLQHFRAEAGRWPGTRFEGFVCIESWRNADGTRYVRPE